MDHDVRMYLRRFSFWRKKFPRIFSIRLGEKRFAANYSSSHVSEERSILQMFESLKCQWRGSLGSVHSQQLESGFTLMSTLRTIPIHTLWVTVQPSTCPHSRFVFVLGKRWGGRRREESVPQRVQSFFWGRIIQASNKARSTKSTLQD